MLFLVQKWTYDPYTSLETQTRQIIWCKIESTNARMIWGEEKHDLDLAMHAESRKGNYFTQKEHYFLSKSHSITEHFPEKKYSQ